MSPQAKVLVDTSAWIEAMRRGGDPVLRERVERLLRDGRTVFCDLVRLELWNGARAGREQRWLRDLEATLETVPTTDAVWRGAERLARGCRSRGLTVPATDLLVAACATEHGLDLLHRDTHFDRLRELGGRHQG